VRKSSVAGLIVGLAATYFLFQLMPDPTCDDGWLSSSIGRRGACSFHGGVERHDFLQFLALLGGALSGFTTRLLGSRIVARSSRIRTPYGTLREYEAHLRKAGVAETQIQSELRKYKGS